MSLEPPLSSPTSDVLLNMVGHVDTRLVLPQIIFALFAGVYWKFAPYLRTERQRAYVLSTLSSGTMTLLSLPFVWGYVAHGLHETYWASQEGWRAAVTQFGVLFFGTYLFADLAIGQLCYPSQIGLLTGWVHHTVYIGICLYLQTNRTGPLLLIAAILELPTFDLAISNLFPAVRSDVRFLTSFFLVRIVFNIVLALDCVRPSSRAMADDSWIPFGVLSLALALHISWFRGGLMGYLKRRAASRAKTATPVTEESDPVSAAAATEAMSELVVDTATAIDPTVSQTTLPPTSPGTPEDSPLVTPRTPSMGPLSLRDSYIIQSLPNLPTITIPTLADLPTVSIPSLSELTAALPKGIGRDNLHFGFKDAVRSKWDEQRERFGAMGLDLGAMGMRRRQKGHGVEQPEISVSIEEVDIF